MQLALVSNRPLILYCNLIISWFYSMLISYPSFYAPIAFLSIESLSKWSSAQVAIFSDCFCCFITSTWWYRRKQKMVVLPYNIHALAMVQRFRPPYSAYNAEARRMKCKFPFDWLPCTISTSLNWSILSNWSVRSEHARTKRLEINACPSVHTYGG